MKKFTSPTQKIGELGEDIAVKWLNKKGFTVIDRNYTKKWGEIDIVAEKGRVTHFIEVKSGKRTLNDNVSTLNDNVSHYSNNKFGLIGYSPAENMHPWKLKRFIRAVETYLMTSKGQKIKDWQIDLLVVYLDTNKKIARCELFEKVI